MQKKIKSKKSNEVAPKPRAPKIPKPFDDEEPEEEFKAISQISLGDITVVSKQGLPACRRTIKGLLKDKTIRNYLDIHTKKKFMSGLSYTG